MLAVGGELSWAIGCNNYLWLIQVAWAFSQHAGWVDRTSIPRRERERQRWRQRKKESNARSKLCPFGSRAGMDTGIVSPPSNQSHRCISHCNRRHGGRAQLLKDRYDENCIMGYDENRLAPIRFQMVEYLTPRGP